VILDNGVEELAAVAAIKTEHFKGHPGFNPALTSSIIALLPTRFRLE
jgi:hypothetical protein